MKKIILFFLIILISFPLLADTYVFTEMELSALLTETVTDVTNKKDLEIAELIKKQNLVLVDKNLEIDTLVIDKKELFSEVSLLEEVNEKQSKYLKWAPVAIITTFASGLIAGIFTAGNI